MPIPDSVLRWAPNARQAALAAGLDPSLVLAIVWQESAGKQYAVRPEPGFFRRYFDRLKAFVAQSPSKRDDRWFAFPDLYSASFGLMQPLYQVALEHGFDPEFPTDLCDPDLNLRVGCAILRRKIDRAGGDRNAGVLAYNGGGRPEYLTEVLAKLAAVNAAGVFR